MRCCIQRYRCYLQQSPPHSCQQRSCWEQRAKRGHHATGITRLFWAWGLLWISFSMGVRRSWQIISRSASAAVWWQLRSRESSRQCWPHLLLLFFLREGLHALGIALLLRSFQADAGTSTLPGWARCISRLSMSVNLTNIFVIHYVRGRWADHPIEFSHMHGMTYTIFAWAAAIVTSLIAHCMVAPYVHAAEAAVSRLGSMILSPGMPRSEQKV